MNLGNNPNPLKSGCKSRGSQNEAEPESLVSVHLLNLFSDTKFQLYKSPLFR